MKIIEIKGDKARAQAQGIQREIGIGFVKAKKGDYVMVHAGFAIEKVDTKEAEKTLEVFKEYEDALRKTATKQKRHR